MFIKNLLTGIGQGAVTIDVEYLVIAGGGGLGGNGGGGGGAGGYREGTLQVSFDSALTLTVGAGGAASAGRATTGPTIRYAGANGSNSVFNTITSAGGGGGGPSGAKGGGAFVTDEESRGEPGGSGGGAGAYWYWAGVGGAGNTPSVSPSQGNDGADGVNLNGTVAAFRSGGGGGAGGAGGLSLSNDVGGLGGAGKTSSITGVPIARAGGGAGYNQTVAVDAGGAVGIDAEPNKGGGGYGTGGSGVVILRVPSTVTADFSAGVVYNYIPVDGFNVYEVTGAGVSDTVTFIDNGPDAVTINDSLRFNDDDSAYLSRTPATTSNQQKLTWSGWVKRANLTPTGASTAVFAAGPLTGGGGDVIAFNAANQLRVWLNGAVDADILTTQLFRDSSAWYHILVAMDTTAAQASDRIKVYVNGRLISDFNTASYPSLNYNMAFFNDNLYTQYIGEGYSSNFDGYLSDVYFIDGEALDPSYFGRMSSDGIWEPIAYAGTSYGTNGFHLDFADNSTAAALGTDVSGNGNNWTPSGITTDDQVSDTPSANYCTWNPLDWNITYVTDGNLRAYNTLNAWQMGRANFGMTTGKWYWEAYSPTTYVMVGIALATQSLGTYFGQGSASWGYYNNNGLLYRDNTGVSFGATWGGSDTIGIAFDAGTGQLTFYKNNVLQGSYTVPTGATYFPAVAVYNSSVFHNFGQRPFTYTPPTGYSALSSANLPTPTITDGKEHFQSTLYTGNGTTQFISGFEFNPDLVWIKARSNAYGHIVFDSVRGIGNYLSTSATGGDNYAGTLGWTSSGTDGTTTGFTVEQGTNASINGSGSTFVAWNWNAGGSTVTNTDGSLTSQVRANTDAGFSIVTFTGTTTNQSVGHGLGVAPTVFIVKSRANAYNWWYYTTQIDGSMDYLVLNGKNAVANGTQSLPTSSVFYQNQVDSSVAYCFAEVDGFSKFGSYTGNGNATYGPFIYTGFRPAFVMIKRTDGGSDNWVMHDSKRDSYNVVDLLLMPNQIAAESSSSNYYHDFLSNGVKIRTTLSAYNASGGTYIYMAFAENPFKTARAR